MANLPSGTGFWKNNDGLIVRLGTAEAKIARGGEVDNEGSFRQLEFNLALVNLTTTATLVGNGGGISLPSGAIIDKVDTIAETAATGTGALLNIGLVRFDTTTNVSDTAIIAAQALSTLSTAGTLTTTSVGTTYAGANLGVALTNPAYVTVKYTTAAFTAGDVKVVVHFHVPQPAASN